MLRAPALPTRVARQHGVFMEGVILKSNIVNPGKQCPVAYSVEDIAQVGLKGVSQVLLVPRLDCLTGKVYGC